MRRQLITLATAFAVLLAMAIPASAAVLHRSHRGTECDGGIATLHFVNNQTGGETNVNLWIKLDGDLIGPIPPADHPSANNHWWIDVTGESFEGDVLDNAWTTIGLTDQSGPGKLVLSDHECNPGKKDNSK